jgi:hypothetical protein
MPIAPPSLLSFLPPGSRPLAHRAAAALLALAVAVLPSACSDEDFPSSTEPVTGSGLVYTLASVEEKALPATIISQGTFTVVRGKLTLSPDSTWILSNAVTADGNAGAATSVTTLRGSYTRTGTALTLSQQTGTAFTGTYSETAVSLTTVSALVVGGRFSYTR